VTASLDQLVQAPPLVMQALTNGPAALASAFFMRDDARIDELLECAGGGGGGLGWGGGQGSCAHTGSARAHVRRMSALFCQEQRLHTDCCKPRPRLPPRRQTQVRSVYTARHEHRVIKASYDTDNARQSTDLRPASLLNASLSADEAVRRACGWGPFRVCCCWALHQGQGIAFAESCHGRAGLMASANGQQQRGMLMPPPSTPMAQAKERVEADLKAAQAELAAVEREMGAKRSELERLRAEIEPVKAAFSRLAAEQAASKKRCAPRGTALRCVLA
jgi:hypothetical protein